MLHNSPKGLLDTVSKLMSESKTKYDQEQLELEAAQRALWEKKLSPKQKVIAAKAGDPNKIDAADFAALRKEETEQSDEETTVKSKTVKESSVLNKYISMTSTIDEARGRPRKNPLPGGSDASSEEEPDHNIVMHLKKSVDTGGNHDVKFGDKSTHKVPSHVASAVLGAMGKLKPADRLEVQKHIQQSHKNLMQVHGMIK